MLSFPIIKSFTGSKCRNDKTKISYPIYVDDLKLTARNENEFEQQLRIVNEFINNIHMEFGLEHYSKTSIVKLKI